jgi:hypothetical protein
LKNAPSIWDFITGSLFKIGVYSNAEPKRACKILVEDRKTSGGHSYSEETAVYKTPKFFHSDSKCILFILDVELQEFK